MRRGRSHQSRPGHLWSGSPMGRFLLEKPIGCFSIAVVRATAATGGRNNDRSPRVSDHSAQETPHSTAAAEVRLNDHAVRRISDGIEVQIVDARALVRILRTEVRDRLPILEILKIDVLVVDHVELVLQFELVRGATFYL